MNWDFMKIIFNIWILGVDLRIWKGWTGMKLKN